MSVILLKTIVLYGIVVLALRIMGKRQLGELQPSELVVTILVSNLATLTIEDPNLPLAASILPIFTLVSCEVIVSVISLKSSAFRRFVSGNARIVIRDGKIDQREMRNLRWSTEDLMEQMRINGIFDISEVSHAVVETSGALTAYQKYDARPVTAGVLGLSGEGELDTPPMVVVSDGRVIEEALRYCGTDRTWLNDTLKQKHLDVKDVFLLTCDKKRNYRLVKKELKSRD